MTGRDQAFMRVQLASVGIVLEPSTEGAETTAPGVPAAAPAIDRAAVRAILVAAGAPPEDLEWLVASAPSIDAAREYRPPPACEAWCLTCDGVRPCDASGCLACRGER